MKGDLLCAGLLLFYLGFFIVPFCFSIAGISPLGLVVALLTVLVIVVFLGLALLSLKRGSG